MYNRNQFTSGNKLQLLQPAGHHSPGCIRKHGVAVKVFELTGIHRKEVSFYHFY